MCLYNQTSLNEPCSITYPRGKLPLMPTNTPLTVTLPLYCQNYFQMKFISITFLISSDIYVQRSLEVPDHFRLTCNTSCPPTNTVWYQSRQEQAQIPKSIPITSQDSFHCAVKGVKDLLHSDEVCEYETTSGLFELNYNISVAQQNNKIKYEQFLLQIPVKKSTIAEFSFSEVVNTNR